MTSTNVKVFFNFRSPYCYLASKTMFAVFENYNTTMQWKPLSGWSGRSAPERAKIKIPLVRQDIARIALKMGIPLSPPPMHTDPSNAALGSILANEKGVLKEYLTLTMHKEWGEGIDIGDPQVILNIGEEIGLDRSQLQEALVSNQNIAQLENNWQEAQSLGVFGVPTFVIGDEVFWGQDRIDYVLEYLDEIDVN